MCREELMRMEATWLITSNPAQNPALHTDTINPAVLARGKCGIRRLHQSVAYLYPLVETFHLLVSKGYSYI